jgi:Phytanoyl-CoA dioxygenase (PhyH)
MDPGMIADPAHLRALERAGWTTLPTVGDALHRLREIAGRAWDAAAWSASRGRDGYHELMHSESMAMRRAAQEELESAVRPYVAEHFPGARIAVSNLLLKTPSAPGSVVVLHQDAAIVDESRGVTALQLWIPLVDVGELDEGGLALVPGTHLVPHPHRAPGDPTPFAPHMARVYGRAVRPRLRAGEVICFHARTLHGSMPNLAPRIRPALSLMLAPRDAELVHYVRRSPREVDAWSITGEALRALLPDRPPAEGRLVGRIEHADPRLDDAAFAAWAARDDASGFDDALRPLAGDLEGDDVTGDDRGEEPRALDPVPAWMEHVEGWALSRALLHPGSIELEWRRGDAPPLAMLVEQRAAASRCFREAGPFALSYRSTSDRPYVLDAHGRRLFDGIARALAAHEPWALALLERKGRQLQ